MARHPAAAVVTILVTIGAAVASAPAAGASAGGALAGRPGRHIAAPGTGLAAGSPFCRSLGVRYQASSAARLACTGPGRRGPATPAPARSGGTGTGSLINTDAASLAEDVTPGGVRAYGQSEVSVASSGRYVVEAWNDATGFLSSCPSPMSKEERIGFGRLVIRDPGLGKR